MNAYDHDTANPDWKPKIGVRVYACGQCGAETTITTNHTGVVWNERCKGKCRNTEHERVLPYSGSHNYVKEAYA